MTQQSIESAARAYVAAETEAVFRSDVEKLIAAADWKELEERFYTDLEFGTGGLRGVIGGGTNRMNSFVVRRATTGLAQYVAQHGTTAPDGSRAAVIAHDSRRYSREFALASALVFAAHGIRTYLFSDLRPTPELSFAVRELNASVGIVITASHNPPQYNGYKVYWGDGAQIVEPHDSRIIERVKAVKADEIVSLSKDEALARGLLVYIDRQIDDAFVAMVKRQAVRPALLKDHGSEVKVVYTPLHGTGAMMVERVLGELGVRVITVPEQREPDGEFPTVRFPNPEEAAALEMAVALARKERADIVIATDPDADRIGIAVPEGDDFRLITGNQLGVLLVDYVFGARKAMGTLPAQPVFVKTIVTTEMQRVIAEAYGAQVYDVLTGFKHIASVMRNLEENPGTGTYVMGDEESYGYLIGTEVRDKDSITATMLTIEMTLYLRTLGKSVLDRLNELYVEHGYYEELTISKNFEGQQGKATMAALMQSLRSNPPKTFGGSKVLRIVDIETDREIDAQNGTVKAGPGLPKSNVLQLFLANGAKISMRPSGTEPKIKFYASCHGRPSQPLNEGQALVATQLEAIEADIVATIARAGTNA